MAKLSYEVVKEEIEKYGWKLISTEYNNLDTELEIRCAENHKVFTTLKKFRRNQICPTCLESSHRIDISNPIKKKPGITRILVLDDATQITGWCIFDGEDLTSYGKFSIDNADPIERISIMRQWLLNMLIKWNPDKIGIEDIQLQSFKGKSGDTNFAVTTYKVLAQLQGVLLEALFSQKKDAIVVHSQTWKAYCGIIAKNRSDQKRSAQIKVKEWYGINTTQDEADAICMGKFLSEKYLKNNTMIQW